MRSTEACRCLVITASCLAALGTVAPGFASSVSSCSRQQEVFCAESSSRSIFNLSHRQVIAYSETVYVDGRRVERDENYHVEYCKGILSLRGGLNPGSCIRITYKVSPFLFKGNYCLRTLGEAGRAAPGETGTEQVPVRREPGHDLRASGSKTVTMEAGSLGGLRVDQSLSLSLGGTVGKSVNIVGVLSDKDFGFDQTSQTKKLKDLDKVFIEVNSPRALARVGDIEMNEAPGDLLRFERNLTGFYASAFRGESGLRASAAASRTTVESAVLEGMEGVSGPYVVMGADGRPVLMVPNKERVWLDGMPMRRGKGLDYTVDYGAGAIYFNPSRFIRMGSRILVDYEVQEYDRGRHFYMAGTDLSISDAAKVALTVVNEHFSSAPAGDEDILPGQSLNLGTDREAGWRDSGRYVGFGEGDFIRVERDSVFFYEYVGAGAGDYDVTFTRVDEESGEYEYVFSEKWQTNIYFYTGEGDYVALIGPSPELDSQVIHLAASGNMGGKIEFSTEGALSKSGERDEGEEWKKVRDGAYSVRIGGETDLPEVAGVNTGAVEFGIARRSIGASYHTFGRIRNPDFLEVWAQNPGSDFEETDVINMGYKLGSRFRADAGMGRAHTDAGRSLRKHARLSLGGQDLGITAMADMADVEPGTGPGTETGGISRRGVDLRLPVSFMKVNLGTRYEERSLGESGSSFRRNEIYSEFRVPGTGGSISLKIQRSRESRILYEAWSDYSTITEGRLEFDLKRSNRLQIRGVLGHSDIGYADAVGLGDQASSACDLALVFRDLYMLSNLSFDYGLANTLTTLYESELIEVGPGGDYDSVGNYVEDGNYAISRREAGRAPVTRLRSRLLMETGRTGKIIHTRRLTTRTEIAVEGESTDGNMRRSAFPGYGEIMHGDKMMLGRVAVSEQVVLNSVLGGTLSANLRGTRGQDRRCGDRVEISALDQIQLRFITNSIERVTVSAHGELRSNRRSNGAGAQALERNASTHSAGMDLERPFWSNLRALFSVGVLREKSTAPLYDITAADFTPGLTVFAGDLRCDARLKVRRILKGETPLVGIYSMQNSLDWNARMSLNHTKYTSISLEYTGRRMQRSRAVHNLRASVNATF